MITKRLHEYFGFNRQQRNGLIALCTLSGLLLGIRLLYPYFLPAPQIEELVLPFAPIAENEQTNKSWHEKQKWLTTPLDPNTAAMADFMDRGLNQRSAKALVRFREKGFVFRKAEDLKKIYGVSESEYERLKPLLLLTPHKNSRTSYTKSQKQIQKVEVNSADSASWCALPGIGPSFAKRIIKYRTLLGGFVRIEQLMEVYGLDEERFNKMKGLLSLKTDSVRMINVNTAEFKTLARHPYIGYELSKLICNGRRKSPFTAQTICVLPFAGDNCARVQAYLRFDP